MYLQHRFLSCTQRLQCTSATPLCWLGAYLANQLDGKIFENPALMPSKMAYSDFVQTKARTSAACPFLDAICL